MKPSAFEYHDPHDLTEVLELLNEYGEEAKLLAGGQSLVPMLNFRLVRPERLIDLNKVDQLVGIRPASDAIVIGAMTRQRSIERSAYLCRAIPLFADVMPLIAHFQIRNRGTIGGSLSHADPAAELPAAAVALDARFIVKSLHGTRVIDAKEFFTGYLTTALEPDELLTDIVLPAVPEHSGAAFLEVSRRHGDFALVGVAVLLTLKDDRCATARIVLTGVAEAPFDAHDAARLLIGTSVDDDVVSEASHALALSLDPPSDLHASGAYRKAAAKTLTGRALQRALKRARNIELTA